MVLLGAGIGAAPAAAQSGARAGGIRGSVYDVDFQVPVAAARVSIVGTSLATATDDGGTFRFDNVPPGTYTLIVSKAGYERRLVAGVVVVSGRLADVRTELGSEVYEMEELVVTGGDLLGGTELGLLEIRAESIAMQDAVSADLISKSGVSSAAGALSLVTGASVAEGKYATVRGLSDRYTGATLNGVRVPSADPRRRAIQIDLFPAGTIESVTVTKTFTPDLLGEFTGGGVDIRTKSVPDRKFLNVEVSVESDAIATGNEEFLTYQGGGVNTFGFAGSERDLKADTETPAGVKSLTAISFSRTAATQADKDSAQYYDGQVRGFAPAMGVSRDKGEPNAGLSLLAGNRFALGGGRVFGALGALTYKRKSFLYEGGENNVAGVPSEGADLVVDRARSDQEGTESLLVGLLGTFVWDLGDGNELGVRLIGNQSADDTARLQVENPDQVNVRQNQTLRYTERSVASGQLYGKHAIGSPDLADFSGVLLDWTGSYNYTRQDEPDVRFFLNDAIFVDNDGDGVSDGVNHVVIDNSVDRDRTRRIWQEIEESNLQLAINAGIPFTQWTESRGNLKGGILVERTDREFDRKSYFYRFSPQERGFVDPAAQCNQQKFGYSSGDPNALWTDVFSAPDRIGIAPDYVTCDFFVPQGRAACSISGAQCTSDADCGAAGGTCEPVPQPTPRTRSTCSVSGRACFLDSDCPVAGETCGSEVHQLLWALDFDKGDNITYDGVQEIDAAHLMAELPLTPAVKVIAGARYETTFITIEPEGNLTRVVIDADGNFNILPASPAQASARIDESDLLPSLSVVWEAIPSMFVRGAWSRTIARPTFRELAPVVNEEFLQGDAFLGNSTLVLSDITNYDLRWEWFPRTGQVLAASLFRKEITNPIEQISFLRPSEELTSIVTPVNFEQGRVSGYEIEARTSLDGLAGWLTGFAVGINFTDLESEVDIPATFQADLATFGLASDTRALQGQPDYLVNANVTYDNERTGTAAGLFFNRVGETLLSGAAVGADGTPNVFIAERDTLNFTFRQRLGAGIAVTLEGSNLLQDEYLTFYRTEDGQVATKTRHATGRRIGVAVGYSW